MFNQCSILIFSYLLLYLFHGNVKIKYLINVILFLANSNNNVQLGRSKTPTAEQLRSAPLHTPDDELRERQNGLNSGKFNITSFCIKCTSAKTCINTLSKTYEIFALKYNDMRLNF